MASPSTWRWPWKKPTDPTIRFSYYSPFSFSSSITYPFHVIHGKRRRVSTFSFNHSPPNCSSGPNNARKRLRKPEKQAHDVEIEVPNRVLSTKRRALSFKSLFGKRALWRRILFASTKVRSIILLNVITLIYASNIPVVKEVEAIMDPAAFTVVRFALTAIPFIPFVIRARGDVETHNAGIELGLWVSLGYLMQALGLLTSDAGRASFISMFTVIVVPLLDGMLGAIVPAHTWFGAFMSIIGVGMLESSGSPPCVGDLLNFLSAVFFGVHMLRTEHISRKTDKEKFLPLLGYEVCVVALSSTMWYSVRAWLGGIEECNPSSWTWALFWDWMMVFPWVPALYTGIFSTGLCLWVEMTAMCDVSATEAAIIYGLEPVWGAGFAWFLLGERWGIFGWIGAGLVLGKEFGSSRLLYFLFDFRAESHGIIRAKSNS
ncbi:hypothetical protein RJ640_026055 [Escallonia rubra]|uniref:EamA domain-containing protein n=1 Tax=Escallonia rubra TaxID=112253 RepID=A0AA88U4C2_9ASTE|nr:hypothetical protein RJ640_026055 [Escallonia rubra]